jgi:replication fork protection complex subunit Tof1/Swi1
LEWYVPAAIVPKELQSTLAVVRQYLAHPFQLDGKKASSLLGKTTKRRRRRRARSSPSPSDADDDDKPKAKKEKRKKEKEVYKSAAMIVDSDEEYGDIEAFLEKEKALRERTERITAEGGRLPTMKTAGTKRRRRGADLAAVKKRWKGGKGNGDAVDSAGESAPSSDADEPDVRRGSSSNVSNSDPPEPESKPKVRAQPKPRFRASSFVEKMPPAKVSDRDVLEVNITSDDEVLPPRREAKKKRIVISDDD